jgi:1-acyl-sn-glycerol-3-phosphate acyltransferase
MNLGIRWVLRMLVKTFYRLEIEGAFHVPPRGSAVLVCNHVSFVDALFIAASFEREVRFVMDHRIFKTPGVNMLFRAGRVIPIAPRREDPAMFERAFAEIASALRAEELVCIFPEGEVTRSGALAPFRPGVERLIHETPVPVVPMALSGVLGSVFSRVRRRPLPRGFRSKVTLRCGTPVAPAAVTARDLRTRVAELGGYAHG